MATIAVLPLVVVSLLIMAVNLWTLVVLGKTRELHTSGYIYVASLSLIDALVGLVFLVRVIMLAGNVHTMMLCRLVNAGQHFTCFCSIVLIAYMAVDRYIFVGHPFYYLRVLTPKRVLLLLTPVWVGGAVIGTLTYVFYGAGPHCLISVPSWLLYLFCLIFVVCSAVTGLMYARVSRLALRLQRPVVEINSISRFYHFRFMLKQKLRGVKMFIGVFVVFTLCWGPWYVLKVVRHLGWPVSQAVMDAFSILGILNSIFNSCVCIKLNTQLREAYRQSLRWCCSSSNQDWQADSNATHLRSRSTAPRSQQISIRTTELCSTGNQDCNENAQIPWHVDEGADGKSVSEMLPDDITSGLPDDITSRLPDDITSRLSDDITSRLPDDITSRLPDDITNGLPDDITSGLPDDITNGLPDDVTSGLLDDVTSGLPDDVTSGLPDDVTSGLPDGVTNGLPDDITNGLR